MTQTKNSKYKNVVGCVSWLVTIGTFDIANVINDFSNFEI